MKVAGHYRVIKGKRKKIQPYKRKKGISPKLKRALEIADMRAENWRKYGRMWN